MRSGRRCLCGLRAFTRAAAGIVDERADSLFVQHAGVVADLDRIACEVNSRLDNMRIGFQLAFEFLGAADAIEVRDGQPDS